MKQEIIEKIATFAVDNNGIMAGDLSIDGGYMEDPYKCNINYIVTDIWNIFMVKEKVGKDISLSMIVAESQKAKIDNYEEESRMNRLVIENGYLMISTSRTFSALEMAKCQPQKRKYLDKEQLAMYNFYCDFKKRKSIEIINYENKFVLIPVPNGIYKCCAGLDTKIDKYSSVRFYRKQAARAEAIPQTEPFDRIIELQVVGLPLLEPPPF